MYSVHAYYLAVLCQCLTCIWFYPVLVTLFSFYCFEFEYSSAEDMLTYMASLLFIALSGSFFGIAIGAFTDSQGIAILVVNLFVNLFNFGAGCLSNTGTGANPVIKFLSWVSPVHYGVEIVFK